MIADVLPFLYVKNGQAKLSTSTVSTWKEVQSKLLGSALVLVSTFHCKLI